MPANTRQLARRATSALTILVAVAASGCGRPATAELIAQTKAADGTERIRAIRSLGDRPRDADRVVPVLVELLADDDAFVRRYAAQSLGQLGLKAEPAAAALRLATRDRNEHVRRAATQALHKVEPSVGAKR
jgi:HEAT repeat protein